LSQAANFTRRFNFTCRTNKFVILAKTISQAKMWCEKDLILRHILLYKFEVYRGIFTT